MIKVTNWHLVAIQSVTLHNIVKQKWTIERLKLANLINNVEGLVKMLLGNEQF